MAASNFINNLMSLIGARGPYHGIPGPQGTGPGGIGGNPSNPDYIAQQLAPGIPSIIPLARVGTANWGRPHYNYSGGGWDIAGQIQFPQGGHQDLYSFREASPAIPKRMSGIGEIAWQIFRNGTYDEYIQVAAPPIPTAGWVPPQISPNGSGLS